MGEVTHKDDKALLPKLLSTVSRRKILQKCALVAVLAVIVLGLFISLRTSGSTGYACSSQLLTQASSVLYGNNQTTLQQIVTKIQKIHNYQKDPNCLYVVVNYDLNKSDTTDAQTYLKELSAVYKSNQGFSKHLGNDIKGIATLEGEVTFLKGNLTQTQNNETQYLKALKASQASQP